MNKQCHKNSDGGMGVVVLSLITFTVKNHEFDGGTVMWTMRPAN